MMTGALDDAAIGGHLANRAASAASLTAPPTSFVMQSAVSAVAGAAASSCSAAVAAAGNSGLLAAATTNDGSCKVTRANTMPARKLSKSGVTGTGTAAASNGSAALVSGKDNSNDRVSPGSATTNAAPQQHKRRSGGQLVSTVTDVHQADVSSSAVTASAGLCESAGLVINLVLSSNCYRHVFAPICQ